MRNDYATVGGCASSGMPTNEALQQMAMATPGVIKLIEMSPTETFCGDLVFTRDNKVRFVSRTVAAPSIADTLHRVRDLSQSSRHLFWSELAAMVEREWDCPPGYDRTAWAMERATAGMVDAAYQRVVG